MRILSLDQNLELNSAIKLFKIYYELLNIRKTHCRYIQIGVPPARVSRPLASHNLCSPSSLGHAAYDLRA
jgi:hypothetical protein